MWRLLEGRPLFARLVANASWLAGERVVLLATGFLVNVWFVRSLGPDSVGQYSYAVSFAALFGALAALGLDSIIVRELTRSPARDGEILGTALVLRFIAGLVTWALTALAVIPMREDATTRLLVAIAAANSLFQGAGVFELWFQARIDARRLVATRMVVTLGLQATRCAFIWMGAPLAAFAALFVAAGAANVVASWALYLRIRSRGTRLTWNAAWARELMADAWPMIAITIGIAVYMKADQVMLASLASDRENGFYAPAVTLSEVWYFLPVAVAGSAYPVIVSAQRSMAPAQFKAKLQSFYDGMAALGYVIAVPMALLATPLVTAFYGEEFLRTAQVLQIHVMSLPFVCLGIARGRYLLARNLLGFTLAATMLGAGINVTLNAVLIPHFGAVGAAWATLVAYVVANYASGLLSREVRGQTVMLSWALLIPFRVILRAVRAG